MSTRAKWNEWANLDGDQAFAAVNRALPAWISALLVVAIAWVLAKIIWSLIPGPEAGDPVTVPAGQAVPSGATDGLTDVQAIADAHIFGVASLDPEVTAAPVIDETENLRETRLTNLSLKGTLAATPAEEAVAIIADSGDKEKVYAIGDPVTAGARLYAVYPNRVVLDENGVLTNLKLPREFPEGTPAVSRRNTRATNRAAMETRSIQAAVAQNVSALADVIRPTPYFVNGQQQGYRVYPGRNRQQFAALGLRPGDLIKDIDGQALTDPTQAMEIFQSLGSADQVSVTVERNGQPEVIVLSTSQLDLGDDNSQ
ncbi:MAG: type II secretion system protein GspC [Woeseiaceae bacterium]|nr:type II secretion system protein GspC [Woeseiaceae bacterium]